MHNVRMSVYAGGESVGRFGALQTPIMQQLQALARVPANPVVGVTAQLDREGATSVRYVLDDAVKQPTIDIGEGNTGDPSELAEFVSWSRRVRPASSEMLVLSGHGLGHLSSLAGWAMTSRAMFPGVTASGERDLLTTAELATALRALAGDDHAACDVIVFDACLMNTVEVITEVAPVAPIAVGTPDELSGGGYNLAGAADALARSAPSLPPVKLADAVVRTYRPQHPADMCVAVRIGPERRDQLIAAFRTFAERARELARFPGGRATLQRVFMQAAGGLNRFKSNGLADVTSLRHAAVQAAPALASPINDAVNILSQCVVSRTAGPAASHLLGVSTACPSSREQWARDRNDYAELQFGKHSGWGSMFDDVFGG